MEQPNSPESQNTKQEIRKRKHTELRIDGKNYQDSKHTSIIKLSFKVNNKHLLSDDNNQDFSQRWQPNKTLKNHNSKKACCYSKSSK